MTFDRLTYFRLLASIAAGFLALPALAQSPCEPEQITSLPRNVLWDRWYTVAVNKRTPFAAYNERAELRPGRRIEIKTQTWKKIGEEKWEETLTVESSFGTTPEPVKFSFSSTRSSGGGTYVGEVSGDRLLVEGPNATKLSLPKDAFFSASFPLFIRLRLPALKKQPKAAIRFHAIPESDPGSSFAPVKGALKLADADKFARSTGTQRLFVQFGDSVGAWWVREDGAVCRIVMPKQKTLVQSASKAAAEAYLN